MFKEMRKKEREIFGEAVEEILVQGQYGTLATNGTDGYPYVVPISYIYDDKCIYFHCAKDGFKLENIEKNNKVAFCVVADTEVLPSKFSTKYKSVIAFGEVSEITGEIKESILLKLIHKYSRDFEEEGKKYIDKAKDYTKVMKINIQHMTGKARV